MNANVPATIPERSAVTAGATPQGLVPTSLAGVWKMSEIIAESGMAPKGMDTPQMISVAIMHGLEIGLSPMTALQSIAVVNGRPTIWGDGALGLIRASGLLESIEELVDGQGDARKATCKVKRKGEKALERSFSWADAKKANLSGKSGPWQNYPDRMMGMRARAFALRDGFADVLRGLSIREEQEDVERVVADNSPPAAPSPPPAPTTEPRRASTRQASLPEETKPAAAQAATPDPAINQRPGDDAQTFNADELLDEIETNCSTIQSESDLDEVRNLFAEDLERLTRSQREAANHFFEQAEERVRAKAAADADPFAIPASFPNVQSYREFVHVMVQSASTLEHAERMTLAWNGTKAARGELEIDDATRKGLQDMVKGKLSELNPEPTASINLTVPARTIAEYSEHVRLRLEAARTPADADPLKKWWFETSELRDELKIPDADRKPLKNQVFGHIATIRDSEGQA